MSKILIANDREDSCSAIVNALQGDHEIRVATNGWRAIELLYDETPDAVVAALHMAGVNGLGVLAAAHDSNPSMPVVLTTRTNLDASVEVVRFGAWDVMVEPFEFETVRAIVARALEAHALREENDRLADDVRRSNEFKGHLLRMMSHDLLNLLNAAKGFGYLAGATRDVDKAHLYVFHMMAALGPIEQMAEEFNTYGLIDAHALHLQVTCVPLADCIGEVGRTVLIDPSKHRLKLPAGAPAVRADRDRTMQILVNLIGNAVKYSPKGGDVEVSTEQRGDEVVCRVRDQGPGIPRAHIDNLFQPFFRLERDRQAAIPGRGLGLTIVKHLVELQGGRVWVESCEGEGTSFYFTLPAAEGPCFGDGRF